MFSSSTHELPGGKKLTVTLDGSTLKKEAPSDVVLLGPGYVMGVYGVKLKPAQKDTIEFSGDWSEISYETQTDETPVVALGVETAGPDFLFLVKVSGETKKRAEAASKTAVPLL